MSIKLNLSAAAFVAFVAMGAATGPASAANMITCDQTIWRLGCSSTHIQTPDQKKRQPTPPRAVNYLDPVDNPAMRDAGGGGR